MALKVEAVREPTLWRRVDNVCGNVLEDFEELRGGKVVGNAQLAERWQPSSARGRQL